MAICQQLDFEPPSLLRQRKVPRRIDDGSDDHLLLVKKKSASLSIMLCLIVLPKK